MDPNAIAANAPNGIASFKRSTMQRKFPSLRLFVRSVAFRAILGSTIPIVVVFAQHLIAQEFPIHFAPSLLAVCLVGWCFGSGVGTVATITAALSVNFFLLKPQHSWSLAGAEVAATISFVVLASFGLFAISSLRGVLERLENALKDANMVARVEGERRQVTETSLVQKLESFESEIARLRGYVESYERAKRFAKVAQTRLVELRTAIEEFPVPIALIGDECGLPVIRYASKDFYALANSSENSATVDMLSSILAPNLRSYPEERHPLIRALRGERVAHEEATWCATVKPQPVHLYIKTIVENRFIAVALIASQRALPGVMN